MVKQGQVGGGRGGKKSKQVGNQFCTMVTRALGWKKRAEVSKRHKIAVPLKYTVLRKKLPLQNLGDFFFLFLRKYQPNFSDSVKVKGLRYEPFKISQPLVHIYLFIF